VVVEPKQLFYTRKSSLDSIKSQVMFRKGLKPEKLKLVDSVVKHAENVDFLR
jgi:hypothetical protein